MTDQDCFVTIGVPNTMADLWCIYEHHMLLDASKPPQLVYVATCKLVDVFQMREARNNSDWTLLYEAGYPLMIRVIKTGTSPSEIHNAAVKHVRSFDPMPRCNMYGYNMTGAKRVLVCSDTREFANQAEAAAALGCSQSAISHHMNGKMPTVKGLTLSYKGAVI